jgi:hypothetical protein
MEKDYLILKRASASRPSGQWNDGTSVPSRSARMSVGTNGAEAGMVNTRAVDAEDIHGF